MTIKKPFKTTIVATVDTDRILDRVRQDIDCGCCEEKHFTTQTLKEFIWDYDINEDTFISISDLDSNAQTAFAEFILDDCNEMLDDYHKRNED